MIAVDNGVARVPIRCSLLTGACTGTVRLANGAQAAATIAAVNTDGQGQGEPYQQADKGTAPFKIAKLHRAPANA